jgi:MbtH protein
MPNPFERDDRNYLVLMNSEDQYSLWPEWIAVPNGWRVVSGPQPRADAIAYIDANWTDMRPKRLVAAMDAMKKQ